MNKVQYISVFPNSSIELVGILNNLNTRRLLLVTGKKSFETSGANQVIKDLLDEFSVVHFYDFNVNPSHEDVEKGVSVFRENECDLIISVGGGSVIDMAKLIGYYHNIYNLKLSSQNLVNPHISPLVHICIPTTAGSGSESTHFAVMYIGNDKFSIADQCILPDFVFIDPKFHISQSSYQKAVSGADALCQAVESMWSIHSTDLSRTYAIEAIRLIWNYLPKVVHEGDLDSHMYVALGANLAGKAINITKTTAAHALSYGFTKLAGIPHGHAVALSLPYFISLHSKLDDENCNDPRGSFFVKSMLNQIFQVTSYVIDDWFIFFESIGLELNLKNLEIESSEISDVIENVNIERLKNNPGIFYKDDLFSYYLRT